MGYPRKGHDPHEELSLAKVGARNGTHSLLVSMQKVSLEGFEMMKTWAACIK